MMETKDLYRLFLEHPLVSTDTRDIPQGCIFFALKGNKYDGNRFAAEALNKGAVYAVADDPSAGADQHILQVHNVLLTLQQLARYHRRRLNIPVIAVTGSNGKTTTKELISAVLRKKYRITATRGNLNNHIGVPLSLLEMNSQTELAVIEMGANHPGEIAALCRIAEPDYGLITNIGKAHLEGFGSFEGVIRSKSELYNFLRQTGGSCFINTDNELLVRQAGELKMLGYGSGDSAQLRGLPEEGSWQLTVRVLFPKGWLYLRSKLVGTYNFENILAAARIGLHFGVDPLYIRDAVEAYVPGNNRSQLLQKGSNRIILDAYNANPTSMKAALENFIRISHPNKVLILGDMLELGGNAPEEHQKIADLAEQHPFRMICLVGAHFLETQTQTAVRKFANTAQLAAELKSQPIANALILIKGSRGIGLELLKERL